MIYRIDYIKDNKALSANIEVEEHNSLLDEEVDFVNAIVALKPDRVDYITLIADEDDDVDAPTEVCYDVDDFDFADDEIDEDEVVERLSDDYGWLVINCCIDVSGSKVYVSNISWDFGVD